MRFKPRPGHPDGEMKILVSAYACSPQRGSEPGVGWGFVSALAQRHELWVMTDRFFADELGSYLAAHPDLARRIHVHYVPRVQHRRLERLWPPAYYWTYRRWHRDAYRLAERLHERERFDLAHQLTMVGFREPGYLWQLGIPFVWGPVGGMGFFPWRFLGATGAYGAVYFAAYNLLNWLDMKFLERPRKAARAAGNALLSVTPENRAGALKYWQCDSTVLAEVGLPAAPAGACRPRADGEPLRLVWSGQHTPGKALNLGLHALSRLDGAQSWQLEILGQGSQTGRWQALAARLGIAARCRFHGWLPRDQALEIMRGAHVMLITSLRDLTATVTVEALALGLPIVCLDHCGFSAAVDERCGVKVAVTGPRRTIRAMTAAIALLARDEPLRRRLAEGALERARQFDWRAKAEVIDRLYRARVAEAQR